MCFTFFIRVYLISIYLYMYFLFHISCSCVLCVSNRISHLFLLLWCLFRVDFVLIVFLLLFCWGCGGATRPGLVVLGLFFGYFLLFLVMVFGFGLVFECFFVVFDTPVDASVFKGFGVFVFVGFAF